MHNPSLRHVYGSLAELNETIVAGGAASLTDAASNARKLQYLDEVSRLIDARCHRGSGFGPWVGTKYYDGDGRSSLYLQADLASLSTLTVAPSTAATPVTATVTTDFYLAGLGDTYEAPYRIVRFHGTGSVFTVGTGRKNVAVAGTWSYPYRTLVLAGATAEAVDTSETAIEVSSLVGLSAGQTIVIDTEQMYVSAVTDSTPDYITVERGVNGTTAAAHDTAVAISRYVYDPSVNTCALRLALRREKSRDAGADGMDATFDGGGTIARESEDTIIRRMLGHTVMLVGLV